MDKLIWIFGKAFGLAMLCIVALVALVRGAVTTLWSSHSDLGLFAAPFVLVIGLLGILYFGLKGFKILLNELRAHFKKED